MWENLNFKKWPFSLCCVSLCCVSLPLRLHLSYLRVLLHDPFHAHFSSGCVLDGHLYMHVAFLSLRSPRSDYDFSSFCSALCLPRCWITSSLTHCLFLWSSFDLLHRPCPRAWQLLPPTTCFWITPDSLRLRDPLFFRSPIRCFYLFLLACSLGCLFAASAQHNTYRSIWHLPMYFFIILIYTILTSSPLNDRHCAGTYVFYQQKRLVH